MDVQVLLQKRMDVQVLLQKLHWAQTQAHNAHCWQEISQRQRNGCAVLIPAVMIKQGDQYVPNTEQQALLKRARPLLMHFERPSVRESAKGRMRIEALRWHESEPFADSESGE